MSGKKNRPSGLVYLTKAPMCHRTEADCFAAIERGEYIICNCLADSYFDGKPCPFFKTKEQYEREVKEYERSIKE